MYTYISAICPCSQEESLIYFELTTLDSLWDSFLGVIFIEPFEWHANKENKLHQFFGEEFRKILSALVYTKISLVHNTKSFCKYAQMDVRD